MKKLISLIGVAAMLATVILFIKTIAWTIRHPRYAWCWFKHRQPFSAIHVAIVFGLLAAIGANAQSTTDNSQIKSAVIAFAQTVSTNREITATIYPSYAPSIVVNGKKDNFGFGAAVLTPVSLVPALSDSTLAQHSFVGLRFDYLAHQAFASTVGVGMKGDFQLWGHNVEAFAQTGVNIPFSGFGIHNGDIGAMAGGGFYTEVYHFTHGSLGIQVSAEKWTQFQGYVMHAGPVFSLSF